MKKTLARIFGVVMAVAVISAPAYGADISDVAVVRDDIYDGAYVYDCATGEETYIPDSGVSPHSNKTEESLPAYNPCSDEEKGFEDGL